MIGIAVAVEIAGREYARAAARGNAPCALSTYVRPCVAGVAQHSQT